MARYTVMEFSPEHPSGFRCTYDSIDVARYAFAQATRRMRDTPESVRWVNLVRRDKRGRVAYVDHAEQVTQQRTV